MELLCHIRDFHVLTFAQAVRVEFYSINDVSYLLLNMLIKKVNAAMIIPDSVALRY